MKTKEEVIKEKWIEIIGEANYESVLRNGDFQEEGWRKMKSIPMFSEEVYDVLKYKTQLFSIRPKSLQNIESNNGWISINSEKDLPNPINGGLWEIIRNGEQYFVELLADNTSRLFKDFKKDGVTHYKIHNKSNPPLHK